ncbi:rhamnan synthesis F family protein [Luteimonas terrae]|uniref:FMN phosphatase YigB (HAD superfamily) n=1 Tax=Luteimonas terrae TaxID=1530191 RepID=A0ABU1Y1V2_9GAMM|nr:rhamnan synthesis F family protein [Luteimonas terrae]MDR7194346.1 FMN phosphatase YigB (HAD superfamily) [Luteimonas terrae]
MWRFHGACAGSRMVTGRLAGLLDAVRRGIDVRGGGLRGSAALVARAWRMLRALGPRGVIARLQAAGRPSPAMQASEDDFRFPPPRPIDDTTLRVGVMLHLFYPDLAEEFALALSRMPVPVVLLISVTDAEAATRVRSAFANVEAIARIEIACVPNRGRDIAPLLVTFREALLELDIVGHLHSKKSLHTGSLQNRWRSYLVQSLLGDSDRIAWQLGMFAAEPTLGMIYPESHETVPLWAHTWLGNVADARDIARRIGFSINPHAYIDFPAGSMFWARIDAIRPLLSLALSLDAFPEEQGQLDGTLQHALERLFVAVSQAGRYRVGVLPRNGALALSSEGNRNWSTYFASSLQARIDVAAVDAALVSLDVFDTLVQRPFLSPEAARAYLSRLAEVSLRVEDFSRLRARAEARARHEVHRDPTLAEIYAAMTALAPAAPVEALCALELATERRLLSPRAGVISALAALRARNKRLVALSDMYLDAATLRDILPPAVSALTDTCYVSCETGLRKDDGSVWPVLAKREGVAPAAWLHIGDNEHADIQQPHWRGMLTPVHVLRAAALLDVVPALRPLRTTPDASWSEQLRLGLIANHFSAIADTGPNAFHGAPAISPRTLGYVVIGPMVLDYLIWLSRLASDTGVEALLFLSREGHLLSHAFERLQDAAPTLTRGLRGGYFLASRQATGLATLRSPDDLLMLLDGTYNGTLADLLHARLGADASAAVGARIGVAGMQEAVFLPEMRDATVGRLIPAFDALLAVAEMARLTYQAYWQESAGNSSVLLADIGYAGTIQRNLSCLLGRPVDGAYFALDGRADARLSGVGNAHARYHDARHGDAHSPVLAHDLLLESILTAPHSQFAGFEMRGGVRHPTYAGDIDTARWSTINDVHTGALAFIDDALAAAGPLAAELEFDADAVQIPLVCIGTGRWQALWLADIGVEDAFTGRGEVPAAGTRTAT